MAQLVILVLAAVWIAVLLPPMLRSRVDNRPNSSVTDFRRQLNKLQSTATPGRGSMRAMGRPLAQSSSPLQRQAAAGRPGQHQPPRQVSMRSGGTTTRQRSAPARFDVPNDARGRSHGDPTGGQRRPRVRVEESYDSVRRQRNPESYGQGPRRGSAQRQPARPVDGSSAVRRRRMNVLFILVATAACTMFLAATTKSTAMLWMFGLSFLGLCGYLYVLAQIREQEEAGWRHGWLEQR